MLALTVVGLLGRLISMRMKKRSFGSSDILLLFSFVRMNIVALFERYLHPPVHKHGSNHSPSSQYVIIRSRSFDTF